MIFTGTVQRVVATLEAAEGMTIRSFQEGRIETEPTFTDRFLGAVEMAFGETVRVRDYKFKARTLRDRGPGAPENEFGADLCGVLDIDIEHFKLSKGFLAQAKIAGKEEVSITKEPLDALNVQVTRENSDYPKVQVRLSGKPNDKKPRLLTQCEHMLEITPDSYVFIYSLEGILVVPASTITNMSFERKPQPVYSKTLSQFFRDFLMSFIGDLRLKAYDDETLRELRNSTRANTALLLQMRQ